MVRSSRRKKSSGAPVSFFSFLDILGGTIGVLVLIVAVFTMQIKPNSKSVQLLASDAYDEQFKRPSYIICNGGGILEVHHGSEQMFIRLQSGKLAEGTHSGVEMLPCAHANLIAPEQASRDAASGDS